MWPFSQAWLAGSADGERSEYPAAQSDQPAILPIDFKFDPSESSRDFPGVPLSGYHIPAGEGVEGGLALPAEKRSAAQLLISRIVHSFHMRRLHEFLSRTPPVTCQSPIWLLGVRYESEDSTREADEEASALFLQDFQSRIWFTYRRDFEALGDAQLTTDAGWGCMLRSGQMMLAEAMICHRLGRPWRLSQSSEEQSLEYLAILSLFEDSSSAPLSIHNLIKVGHHFGLVEGAWLGPYILCRTLEMHTRSGSSHRAALGMTVHVVSGDGQGHQGGAPVLWLPSIAQHWNDKEEVEQTSRKALLLLVPLVLGVDCVNPRYLSSLRAVMGWPQSVGILGGKPSASTFVVGVQGDSAIYLDPHEVQPVAPVDAANPKVDTSSYHCSVVRRMPLEALDPSLALGFLCTSREALDDLCVRTASLAQDSEGAPLFTVGGLTPSEGHKTPLPSMQDAPALDPSSTFDESGPGRVQVEEDWQII